MRREVEGSVIPGGPVVLGFAVTLVMGPSALRAQVAPFAGQGAQMPDPKQISGVPLPVADIPVGTVTVRVIRGQLANILPDQTVELTGAGAPKTATTDQAGRATFSGLPPGSRVKASVSVGGERIESQEFAVPAPAGTPPPPLPTHPPTDQHP